MRDEIKKRIEQINNGIVPEGYKNISGGIVPCDYEEKIYGDLFKFYGGLGIPRNELSDTGIPYLHYGDMHINTFTKINYSQYAEMPKYDGNVKGDETFLLDDGDVVFLDASEDLNGTSRCVVIDNPKNRLFISGLHTFVAKSKNDDLVKDFKQYISMPRYIQKQFETLAVGFKVYGLNRNTVRKIVIAYPPNKDEQQHIADILMKLGEAVSLQEKLVEKLDEQKKAFMQRLLGPKENWKKVKIGSLVVEKTERNKIACENVMSISNKLGFINQEEQFTKQVASEDKSNYKLVLKDYIAYNPSRINVGSIAIYKNDDIGIVSPMYIVFECKIISPKLLLLLLSTNKGKYDIGNFLSGSVRDSLNFGDLCEIKIKLPPTDNQKEIIKIFDKFEQNIDLNRQKLEKLKQQQKSLMQLLLTGIVRV
ncbi:MAG: restriction endonuclease subunit S [Oscillospiraceae bacterium]|nr:restriction endonuclease subunit S [Oscillospiraceae bacterium]